MSWRAQFLECAQAVCSRGAFKRIIDHARKHMLGCTRNADIAGEGHRPPASTTLQASLAGPSGRICKSHKKYLRRARIWRKILPRWRHTQARDASTLDSWEKARVHTAIKYTVLQRPSVMYLSAHRNHLTAVVVIQAILIYTPSQDAYCGAIA